ncbi:Uncharacterized protein OBRU01_13647 [Operophtera brumata]|uniref:Uncharacterized protein n=1 Tax=Operophtera brumata TaxID=104452 RepID=A0A0L7L7M0_OPEBR|nr:Uncharacterized protein OBRU01_13647 [Operophtera brumata]
MLRFVVLLNIILRVVRLVEGKEDLYGEFGAGLVSDLRDEANLDLSVDEEYEDLRAELLAYHTALAELSAPKSRRSMSSTPCWQRGGVCINRDLCTGFKYLTEIPGCLNSLKVCCFAWDKYQVRDFKDHGIGSLAMPWSLKQEFGGEGVLDFKPKKKTKKQRKQKKEESERKKLNLITDKSPTIIVIDKK